MMKLKIQVQIFMTTEWRNQAQAIKELLVFSLHLQLGNPKLCRESA